MSDVGQSGKFADNAVGTVSFEKPILAVIGGFHLHHETTHRVHEIADGLLSMEIPAFYSGHCTGEEAMGIFQDTLGHRMHQLYTGLEIEF